MGFFTNPTKDEIGAALGDYVGPDAAVAAFVIGQRSGGRTAVVATDTGVYVVDLKMFKLAGTRLLAHYEPGEQRVRRSGLKLSVGDVTVKLGVADNSRAAELESLVNSPAR